VSADYFDRVTLIERDQFPGLGRIAVAGGAALWRTKTFR
jgi:hypothetical protein